MQESSSVMKGIGKPSYVDVVCHKASNQKGRSQSPYPIQMGSHKGSSDFQELTGGSIFNRVKCHSVAGHGGNPRNLASKTGELSPYSKLVMKKHGEDGEVKSASSATNSEETVNINDEPRRVASPDRPSDSFDLDSANHDKGMEEHVGMANLINDKSSLFLELQLVEKYIQSLVMVIRCRLYAAKEK
ncbi:hypothetical protein Ancab_015217 [Ancistrocladus abbreviatus]